MARLLGILLGAAGAGLALYWAFKPGEALAAGSPREAQQLPPPAPPPDWWDALKGAAKQMITPRPPTQRGTFPPLVERWRSEVTKRAGDMPVDPILEWIRIESNGDTCAPGSATEVGIFQLKFPGDAKYGATLQGLRDICQRSKGRRDSSDLSWMTAADMDMEVGAGIRKIAAARDQVRQVFASSGVAWPEDSFDFWSAIKQIHATPAVITELVPAIARRGHVPANWSELHDLVMAYPIDLMGAGLKALSNAPSQHGLKNRLEDTLRNASFVGLAFARGAPKDVV